MSWQNFSHCPAVIKAINNRRRPDNARHAALDFILHLTLHSADALLVWVCGV